MIKTANGRPAFVVNVEVFLRRDDRWLLIKRGDGESHAPGTLAGVGGKAEPDGAGERVLEVTARREVAEEIGVDLTAVPLAYAASEFFVTDDGDPVINVVFAAPMPPDAEPVAASPAEVAGFVWLTLAEAEADPACPAYVLSSLRAAAAV